MVAVMAGRLLRASVISAHQRGSEDGRDTHIARRSMTVAQRSESAAVGITTHLTMGNPNLETKHMRLRVRIRHMTKFCRAFRGNRCWYFLRKDVLHRRRSRTLRFIPNVDLPSVDPVWTTLCHGNVIYDQLLGMDTSFRPQPQMLASHRTYADNTPWELTLREGLMFHDNTPVLVRDCVASILRWARRDSYGSALLARTDEIAATSDRVIRIRLKRPFALLPETLAQRPVAALPRRAGRVEESDGQYRLPSLQSPAQAVQQSRHSAPGARLRELTNIHGGQALFNSQPSNRHQTNL
jgi:hypothetical protein